MNLIFLGYPGSGKGTIAKVLAQFKQISTGDLLRAEIASGSDLGKQIAAIINQGNLVSDEMALKTIEANYHQNESYIFDGFPRTLRQAEMLTSLVGTNTVAVLFDISKTSLTERIVNRRSCKTCGEIYNLKSKPPKVEDTCDKCGSTGLIHRADDQEETLKKRLSIFEKDGLPVVDYYKNTLKNLIVINADQEAGSVEKEFRVKVLGDKN